MKKLLILFAHPRYEQSRTNKALVNSIPVSDWITFRDLYEEYPDFNIDVLKEQQLLLEHDIIVWQHPFYWYSAPPLMKQWIDMVLTFGWAYGPGGEALKGKMVFNALTSGGAREVYRPEGRNRYTLAEFLRPFEQTAFLCHMTYLPPFAVQGTHRLGQEELHRAADDYHTLLQHLIAGNFDGPTLRQYALLNDWLPTLPAEKAQY